jgi:hypothetical protein
LPPKSGAMKEANPGLALFVPRAQHLEFLALSPPLGEGGTPTPLWLPIPVARLYRGKRNCGAEHTSQFLATRQLSPAAFSELHTPAAAFIDAKGPIRAR